MKKAPWLLAAAALVLLTLTGCPPPGGMKPPVHPGDREYEVLIFVHKKGDQLPSDRHVGVIANVNVATSDGRPFIQPFDDATTTPWTYRISIPAEFEGTLTVVVGAVWPDIQRFGEVGDVFGCDLSYLGGRTIKGNSRQVGNKSVDRLAVHCDTVLHLLAVA